VPTARNPRIARRQKKRHRVGACLAWLREQAFAGPIDPAQAPEKRRFTGESQMSTPETQA